MGKLLHTDRFIVRLLLYCCMLPATAHAQEMGKVAEDSLMLKLQSTPDDTNKVKKLLQLANTLQYSNTTNGIKAGTQALNLSNSLHWALGSSLSNSAIGLNYLNKRDYSSAYNFFTQSLKIAEQFNIKQEQLYAFANLAHVYDEQSNYAESLRYYFKALKIGEAAGNKTDEAYVLRMIGKIYQKLEDYEKAKQYHQKALGLYRAVNDKIRISIVLGLLGEDYLNEKNYTNALEVFQQSLEINKEQKSKLGIGTQIGNIGKTYFYLGDYPKSIANLEESLKMLEGFGSIGLIARQHALLGDTYLNIAKQSNTSSTNSNIKVLPITQEQIVQEAVKHLKMALEYNKQVGDIFWTMTGYQKLSDAYQVQNNAGASLAAYKEYVTLKDSILNNKKKLEISTKEMEFLFSKKEDSLKLQQAITDGKLKEQLLANEQAQQKNLLSQKELALATKDKDLQHLAFLKTQAELENAELEKQKKEGQVSLLGKEKQLQLDQLASLTREKEISKEKVKQYWIITGIVLALLILGLAFWLFKNRATQLHLKTKLEKENAELAKAKAEQQLKEAELTNRMNEISLTALRSQMNPHFLFNCLNSIKLFTMENNTMAATDYLGKFSKLIRNTLDNSANNEISLKTELETLVLYIELEAMRFKDKLQFEILVDSHVDAENIAIPPLLVQPYVENAIWHGLMHKEEGGQLHIHVQQPNNNSLRITIVDNGVGRAKAAELKSKSSVTHKSHGTRVTNERIRLMHKKYGINADVAITDLFDNHNQPAGTQVTINLPLS